MNKTHPRRCEIWYLLKRAGNSGQIGQKRGFYFPRVSSGHFSQMKICKLIILNQTVSDHVIEVADWHSRFSYIDHSHKILSVILFQLQIDFYTADPMRFRWLVSTTFVFMGYYFDDLHSMLICFIRFKDRINLVPQP